MEDLTQTLSQKIQKSQVLLASWNSSKSLLTETDVLQELNNIFDNGVLAALKEILEIHYLRQANMTGAVNGGQR